MGKTSQELLVVIRIAIPSLRDAPKAPAVGLPNEGAKFGVLQNDENDESVRECSTSTMVKYQGR